MKTETKSRNDIQALRAAAVSMVVLFHFWPGTFSGGFAGVDVFFVISGFLISSHLFSQVRNTGRIALAEFWARRARRLLPAALFVILITVIFTLIWLPSGNKIEFAKEGLASTFYSENWLLAFNAKDYFAQTTASPFQHYWSLAVEEQFYLVWPLVISALVLIGLFKRRLSLVVGFITVISFSYSLLLTAADPKFAYFTPFTRVWEFGIGAILALPWVNGIIANVPARFASLLSLLGFAGLAVTILVYSESTPFPGLAALLPTLATALVIFSGMKAHQSWFEKVFAFRPIGFVGEISYSLYLWHWPLIVLPAYVLNGRITDSMRVLLLVMAVLLAWGTKTWVEDRVRFASNLVSGKPRASLFFALGLSAVVAVASVGMYFVGKAERDTQEAAVVLQSAKSTFGANWLDIPKAHRTPGAKPIMPLEQARHDGADPGAKCMTLAEKPEPIICQFGSEKPSKRVLLVGDSHAGTHLGAFKMISKKFNWHLTLAYKAGCSFSLVPRNDTARGVTCFSWNKQLQTIFAGEPAFDYVFTTSYVTNHLQDLNLPNWDSLAIYGFKNAWRPLITRGATVIAIRDNPEMNSSMTKCWNDSVLDASKCTQPIQGALHADVSQIAAQTISGVKTLDLTDFYCFDGKCPAVIGGVYVYRNPDHIGGTYDKSMAVRLQKRIVELLKFG